MASSRVTTENTDLHRTSKRNATSRAVLARRQRVELGAIEALAGRVAANDLENQSQDAMSPDCVVEITTPRYVDATRALRRVMSRAHNVPSTIAMLYRRCIAAGINPASVMLGALQRLAS